MKRWSPAGAAAFVIALFVSAGWAAALVLAASPITDTITQDGVQLLSTLGGALIGALAAYLGSTIRRDPDDQDSGSDSGSASGGAGVSSPSASAGSTRFGSGRSADTSNGSAASSSEGDSSDT